MVFIQGNIGIMVYNSLPGERSASIPIYLSGCQRVLEVCDLTSIFAHGTTELVNQTALTNWALVKNLWTTLKKIWNIHTIFLMFLKEVAYVFLTLQLFD